VPHCFEYLALLLLWRWQRTMGKVTVYCRLSGCTPEIASSLSDIFTYADIDEEPGPIVLRALTALVDDEGQEDMTVIGMSDRRI